MSIETTKSEMQREKRMNKTEKNIQELWENYKRCNIFIIRIAEAKDGEKINKRMF